MSTYKLDRTGAQIDADLGLARAALPATGGTLGTYAETGATLAQSGAALAIPLDGRVRTVTPSAAITTVTVTAPTAPIVASAVVYFAQGATGYDVTLPSGWYWSDGSALTVSAAANAISRLTLTVDPAGNVHADLEYRSVPA